MTTDTITTDLVVDRGPVLDAARILVEQSTLAGHVTISNRGSVAYITMDDTGIPYAMWGSGTQVLWRLLSAIAYTRHEVSLYEVAARCDSDNRAAVATALAALMGASA